MVHTIFRRTLTKKVLLSLILFTYVTCAASAEQYGLGVFVINKKDSQDIKISTTTYYDPSTGRIIGERVIEGSDTINKTNPYVPFFFWENKYLGLSASDKYQDVRLKKEHQYFYYSIGLYRIMYREILEITESRLHNDCVVSCSYITKTRSYSESSRTEYENVEESGYIASIGIKYKNWHFDFDQNANFRLFSSLSF